MGYIYTRINNNKNATQMNTNNFDTTDRDLDPIAKGKQHSFLPLLKLDLHSQPDEIYTHGEIEAEKKWKEDFKARCKKTGFPDWL